jgi:hypothetical protein
MEPESRPAPPASTPFAPRHLTYDLTRRQRLASHLSAWTRSWPGLLLLVGAPVLAVASLAWLVSPWFLLLFLVWVPPMSFVQRFAAGIVQPLLYGPLHMDLVIEEDRLGYLVHGDRRWLAHGDIARLERFGAGTWRIHYPDGTGLDIPASLVDPQLLDHLRAKAASGER